MADPIEKARQEVNELVKAYFSVGDTEAETLMKVAASCARTQGLVTAGVGGAAMAGVGSVTIPGIGAVPGWVAGALAGFIGGTTACIIARRSVAEGAKEFLSSAGKSEADFKAAVRSVLKHPIMPMNHPDQCKA